jgi:hypothetical protein
MQIQREIDRRIEKKKQEIVELERQLGEARAYLAALVDTSKWLPKSGDQEATLRAGSDLAKARDLIKSHGHAMHVSDILKGIGKEINKANRISLSGSLGGYARKGTIFTKPAPNTFGLIEFENGGEAKPDETAISLSDSPPSRPLVSGGLGAFGVKMTQPQKMK